MLDEAVALLQPAPGRIIVDGTLGGGGHALALLDRGATVVGVDRDPSALAFAAERLARFGDRFRPRPGRFGEVLSTLEAPVDGVLLDLGVSSPQLDRPERGFSFMAEGPLDMRMGDDTPRTAARLIEELSEEALVDILSRLGEERFARAIARSLKAARPATTSQAVAAVKQAVPRRAWPRDIHVATRTFQALRIAVNDELGELERALGSLPAALTVGGRAAIISFHSLEDRAVKHRFRELSTSSVPVDLMGRVVGPAPVAPCRLLTKSPVTAGDAEVANNPRARSAHLRAVERVA